MGIFEVAGGVLGLANELVAGRNTTRPLAQNLVNDIFGLDWIVVAVGAQEPAVIPSKRLATSRSTNCW